MGADWSHLIEYLNTTHVGERIKLLHCWSPGTEVLAKMLASAPKAVSKYRANVPDHFSGHYKMVAGSGLGTRLLFERRASSRTAALEERLPSFVEFASAMKFLPYVKPLEQHSKGPVK